MKLRKGKVSNRTIKTENDMKGRSIVYWTLILLTVSCVKEEEGMGKTEPEVASRSVTFEAGTENVGVLIFGRNDTVFTYSDRITSGWDAEGRTSVQLETGDYKFWFYKSALVNTQLLPDLLTSAKTGEVKISLREDLAHAGYYLPADEVFLAASPEMAEKVYEIRGGDTVRNTLTRAVGQIVLELKRGALENGQIDSLPYGAGETIMDFIKEVTLDISNVGEAAAAAGGIGSVRTLWTSTEMPVMSGSGFARFEGPFVFPPEKGRKTAVKITLTPESGGPFPELIQTVEGLVERNKKLTITLWITSTYRFIGVTVKTDPISETMEGDKGIWE